MKAVNRAVCRVVDYGGKRPAGQSSGDGYLDPGAGYLGPPDVCLRLETGPRQPPTPIRKKMRLFAGGPTGLDLVNSFTVQRQIANYHFTRSQERQVVAKAPILK